MAHAAPLRGFATCQAGLVVQAQRQARRQALLSKYAAGPAGPAEAAGQANGGGATQGVGQFDLHGPGWAPVLLSTKHLDPIRAYGAQAYRCCGGCLAVLRGLPW